MASRLLRVGVAGGGPAGLALASILAREGRGRVAVRVFEAGARGADQGAGWDVDAAGVAVLRRAGVPASSYQRELSDTFKLAEATPVDSDDDGVRVCARVPAFLSRLGLRLDELNRECNRTRIVGGLEAAVEAAGGEVVHGVRVGGLIDRGGGGVELLDDAEGSLGSFDVVVDALGVSSRLRGHRFTEPAFYTGCTFVQGVVADPERSMHPELVRRLGEGSIFWVGPGAGGGHIELLAQRFGADAEDTRAVLCAKLYAPGPGDVHAALDLPPGGRTHADAPALGRAKELLDREFAAWPRAYRDALGAMGAVRVLPIFMHPRAAETRAAPGSESLAMLSIGDALHALPPWSGMSGNFALRDAADAADALLQLRPGEGAAPALRALEDRFMRRTEDRRERSIEIARRQAATAGCGVAGSFDFYQYFGPRNADGSRTVEGAAIEVFMRGLTALNRLEGHGMRARGAAVGAVS